METKLYLNRIRFPSSAPLDVSFETLSKLQTCHQSAVPFENFQAIKNLGIDLRVESLFRKIVVENRGGWCHELNTLFSWLLKEIGFTVTIVSSSAFMGTAGWNRPYDHMALLVDLEGIRYLVDVGWGGYEAPFKPMAMEDGFTDSQPNGLKQLRHNGEFWELWYKRKRTVGHHIAERVGDKEFVRLFRFETIPRIPSDFQEVANLYHDDPTSTLLCYKPMVTLRSEDGRSAKVISGSRFTRIFHEEEIEQRQNDLKITLERMETILDTEFGMKIDLTGVDENTWKQ